MPSDLEVEVLERAEYPQIDETACGEEPFAPVREARHPPREEVVARRHDREEDREAPVPPRVEIVRTDEQQQHPEFCASDRRVERQKRQKEEDELPALKERFAEDVE